MIRNIGNGLLLTLIGAVGLFSWSGCDSESDILTPTELAPPTNLQAVSGNTSVSLTWAASPDSGSSDFAGYRIVTTDSLNSMVDSTNTAAIAGSYTVFGLVNGGIYTFAIQSVNNDGSVSQVVTMQWGPTVRFDFQSLYEYESTEPSGLQLLSGQRFNFTIANQDLIDLWNDGRAGATPLLKSPDDFDSTAGWRHTLFVETTAMSFDEHVDVPDIRCAWQNPRGCETIHPIHDRPNGIPLGLATTGGRAPEVLVTGKGELVFRHDIDQSCSSVSTFLDTDKTIADYYSKTFGQESTSHRQAPRLRIPWCALEAFRGSFQETGSSHS